MKRIYLVRHGQTDYNLKGIMQGSRVDTDLNATGIEQSHLFFEVYKNHPFKKVYTSVLKRSIQSVQKFIELGIPHQQYIELNEISWGNKDGKIISFKDSEEYRTIIDHWENGNTHMALGEGESPQAVQTRLAKAMAEILEKADEEDILICMHGRAIRILLCFLLGKDLCQMETFGHDNLGLNILEYDNKKMTLIKGNDISHLLKL